MSKALRISNGPFGRVALLDMDRSLVRHAHPHCHVLLKIGGDDTRFQVGDAAAPLTDDTAVLVNAWEPHAYVHDPRRRNALILALYIEPAWLRGFRANWGASGSPGFFARPGGTVDAAIRALAQDLVAEMVHEPEPSPRQEDLLSALMVAVIERFTEWRSVAETLALRPPSDRRVRRAIAVMRADIAGCPGVDAVAAEAGVSRAHFFRLFERSTGMTPHVFLNALRVERAVERVALTETSLAEIGLGLGFGSGAHFSRFFRDHVSVPPAAFRAVVRLRA